MKNAPIQTTNESAPSKRNHTKGILPKRVDTVRAEILAALLESSVLTGMDSVFQQSTTRLSAVIYTMEHEYGWHIERRDTATGTNDGRIATITAYWINQETIAYAFEIGARDWILSVQAARVKLRTQSKKCKLAADKINASRKYLKTHNPRQVNLWGTSDAS